MFVKLAITNTIFSHYGSKNKNGRLNFVGKNICMA
jgi:hypothetical protein